MGEAAEVGSETHSNPEIALWDDAGMLGRLVHELSRAYGTDDARRIVLHVVRNSLPSDEVARETRLAAQGYTLSVEIAFRFPLKIGHGCSMKISLAPASFGVVPGLLRPC